MLDKKHYQKIKSAKTGQTRPFSGFTKTSSTLPRVVWAGESKTGLRFEIGPSYDDVPTRSQLVIDGQSSCIIKGACGGRWWFVLWVDVEHILVPEYERTRCASVAWSLTLCIWWIPIIMGAHELPRKVGAMQFSTQNIVRMCAPYWLWIGLGGAHSEGW